MTARSYETQSFRDSSSRDAHRLADVVSDVACQTANQAGRAFEYLSNKSGRLRERASTVARTARQHPACTWMAIGLVAFGLGFFLKGSRANK